jgi:hypothetical protein
MPNANPHPESVDSVESLDALRRATNALRAGEIDVRLFAQTVNESASIIAALPPAYERAMTDIVIRLESSAPFAGESCSFNPTDLFDALDVWLTKAQAKLAAS